MNRKICWSMVCVIFIAALCACGSGNNKVPPPVETIVATSGSAQSTVIATAFANPLVATVSTGGTPDSGVVVTFTAPASGASGTFNSGSTTATATTDSNGVATSPTFTANGTAGGPYSVMATAPGVTSTASFTLTNTTVAVASSQFSFYLSGQEAQSLDFYALAGSVTIDANGNVLGGEQDFNDGDVFTFPQDSITGGSLSVNKTTGQGTLTLSTANTDVGVGGTETLGIQFVNGSHALIIEFDAAETSSGSLDLQTTIGSGPSGSYAFALNGVAVGSEFLDPVVTGGVFTVNGGSLTSGVFDVNDAGAVTFGTGFNGTVSGPDASGRGIITVTTAGISLPTTIVYYVVGPEAIRLIDMDSADTAVGSAFGQGDSAGGFNNSSLGDSVFSVESNVTNQFFSVAGQITTNVPAVKQEVHTEGISNNFNGVADDIEYLLIFGGTAPVSISGTYSINTSGYGNVTIGIGQLGDVSALGIYMVDPNINILDPNNTTSGTGGALVVDLDDSQNGTGILLPQTDTATGAFSGSYAFGMSQIVGCEGFCQVDYLGEGTVTAGVLSGAGLLNDPLFTYGEANPEPANVSYAGTFAPDGSNAGRYTMSGSDNLQIQFIKSPNTFAGNFDVVVYQANGGQVLWMEVDPNSATFAGSLEQQGSLDGIPQPAAKLAAAGAKQKLN